jgi:hypothetical protein
MSENEREKTFTSGFTIESLVILPIPIILAIYLFIYGMQNDRLFPPQAEYEPRFLFVFGPIALGGLIILVSIMAFVSNLFIKLTFTKDRIFFIHGRRKFECTWKELEFYPPPRKSRHFTAMVLRGGRVTGRVYSAFLPGFDKAVSFIRGAKQCAFDR